MCRNFSKVIRNTSLALAASCMLSINAAADEFTHPVYTTSNYLPVRADGHRYSSNPYGETSTILNLAQQVKSHGIKQHMSSRGLAIPNKSANRIIDHYEYTFPATCGGQTFSYYEGNGFSALGWHTDGKVVFDLLQGGSPYSAPRLWGPYDQVLNDPSPMHLVYSEGGKNGFGLAKASFLAGMVADMSSDNKASYGKDYSASVYTAGSCSSFLNNILVQK